MAIWYRPPSLKNTAVISAATAVRTWDRVILDMSGGAFQITLPTSPNNNDLIEFVDKAGVFASNSPVLVPNGKEIHDSTNNFALKGPCQIVFHAAEDSWYMTDHDAFTSTYETLIGDGVATSFTIDHNLNSTSVEINVRRIADGVEPTVSKQIVTPNRITIGFLTPPTTDEYSVTVAKLS